MTIYVVTVYNTFPDGRRYVEVQSPAFKTLNEARERLENIGMKPSMYNDLVYEDVRTGFNLGTGKFEKMHSALITEVEVAEETAS